MANGELSWREVRELEKPPENVLRLRERQPSPLEELRPQPTTEGEGFWPIALSFGGIALVCVALALWGDAFFRWLEWALRAGP